MTSVMSSQLDKVGHSEVTSLREIQREVERKETDILRLQVFHFTIIWANLLISKASLLLL